MQKEKNGEKWLFFIFLRWTWHHQDTLQEYLLFFFNSTGWNAINISSERMKFQGCSCGIWLQSKQIKTAWPPSSPLTQHAVSYHFFLTRSLLDLIWRAAALAATWGYRQWIHWKLNRWSKKSKNNVPHSSAWIPNQTVLSNYMEHELNIKICHLM